MIKTISSKELNNSLPYSRIQVLPFSACEITHRITPSHRHDFFEVIFVTKGKEYQLIDNTKHPINDNQIFLLSPYNIHNIDGASIDEAVVITFDESTLYKTDEDYLLLQNIIFGFGLNQNMIASIPLAAKLSSYIKMLSFEIGLPIVDKEIIYSLLKIILISIQNEFKTNVFSSYSNKVDQELFYNFIGTVNDSFRLEHTASYYANSLNVSPAQLNKTVQKVTGKNTLSAVHERIIQEIKRLLIHTNSRNKTIAFELGFKDEAYFSRFFKKMVGMSPKDFKTKNVQQKE